MSSARERGGPSLQSILDHLPAMIGYWDGELRNVAANAAYLDWFGRTPQEMSGMHMRDALGEEFYEQNRPYAEAALAGEPQLFDRTIVDPAGNRRHTQTSYVPDVAEGRVRGFFVHVAEITARVEAEERSRRGVEEYRSLVRSIPGGFVVLFDEELRYRLADGQALETFGFAPADLEGRTIGEALSPERVAELRPHYEAALRGEQGEWDYSIKDSVFHLTAGPVRDGDGRIIAGMVVCTDVTVARRSAAVERALHAISVMIAGKASVEQVVAVVAERLLDVFGLDWARVVRFEEGAPPYVMALLPEDRSEGPAGRVRAGDGSATGYVMEDGSPVIVDYEPGESSGMYEAGIRCSAAAPIDVHGTLWGAVAVASSRPHRIDEAMLARLASFAELVAVALGNAEAWTELSRLATHDGITGLPNHRSFYEHLAREIAKAYRHERPLALAMLDVDRFKLINDNFGHPAGDEVLAELAGRMRESARGEDVLARIGGEEFALLMPDTTAEDAASVAERVRQAVASSPFSVCGAVTVSVGVSCLGEAVGGDLVSCADQALYEAKRSGRNRTVRWMPSLALAGR